MPKKKIIIKNVILFIFLTKFFLKDFTIDMHFKKYYKNIVNILKAPCRHKKFFHKLVYEYYTVNIVYKYKKFFTLKKKFETSFFFYNLKNLFNKIGTTSLNRTKILVILPTVLVDFFKI